MLTYPKAVIIVNDSVQEVAKIQPEDLYLTLRDSGIATSSHLDVLKNVVHIQLGNSGYSIHHSSLNMIHVHSTIDDLVQTICAYSLPGDEPFEEPPGDATE